MKRRAVIVGVDGFEGWDFWPLKHAVDDAIRMNTLLHLISERAPFDQIHLLRNPSDHEVRKTVTRVVRGENRVPPLGRGDLFLFYFAGHGKRQPGGKYLLLCPQAERSVLLNTDDTNGTITDTYLRDVAAKGVFDCLLIFDACRSALLPQDVARRDGEILCAMDGEERLRDIGKGKQAGRGGVCVTVYSCRDQAHASEVPKLEAGLFTYAFDETVQNRLREGRAVRIDNDLILNELAGRMRDRTPDRQTQMPGIYCEGGPGVVLVPGAEDVKVAAVPAEVPLKEEQSHARSHRNLLLISMVTLLAICLLTGTIVKVFRVSGSLGLSTAQIEVPLPRDSVAEQPPSSLRSARDNAVVKKAEAEAACAAAGEDMERTHEIGKWKEAEAAEAERNWGEAERAYQDAALAFTQLTARMDGVCETARKKQAADVTRSAVEKARDDARARFGGDVRGYEDAARKAENLLSKGEADYEKADYVSAEQSFSRARVEFSDMQPQQPDSLRRARETALVKKTEAAAACILAGENIDATPEFAKWLEAQKAETEENWGDAEKAYRDAAQAFAELTNRMGDMSSRKQKRHDADIAKDAAEKAKTAARDRFGSDLRGFEDALAELRALSEQAQNEYDIGDYEAAEGVFGRLKSEFESMQPQAPETLRVARETALLKKTEAEVACNAAGQDINAVPETGKWMEAQKAEAERDWAAAERAYADAAEAFAQLSSRLDTAKMRESANARKKKAQDARKEAVERSASDQGATARLTAKGDELLEEGEASYSKGEYGTAKDFFAQADEEYRSIRAGQDLSTDIKALENQLSQALQAINSRYPVGSSGRPDDATMQKVRELKVSAAKAKGEGRVEESGAFLKEALTLLGTSATNDTSKKEGI